MVSYILVYLFNLNPSRRTVSDSEGHVTRSLRGGEIKCMEGLSELMKHRTLLSQKSNKRFLLTNVFLVNLFS